MAETLTIRTATSTEVVKIAVPGPQGPKGDKGDPGDVAGLPLTTQGDTLYRGASQNERLPIGTSGQILKVSAGGIPEWGAAPATGVTSVALASSDLTITGSPITSSGTITANVTVNGLTLNKLETIQSAHFLGRHGSGAGDVQPVSASQARIILNVADGAEVNVNADWNANSGDAQILNKPSSFTPSAHSSTHHTGGTDAIAPNQISAQWALETRSHSFFSTGTYTLAQGRNVQLDVSVSATNATGTVTLPRLTTDGAQNGDDLFIVASSFSGNTTLIIQRYIWTGSSYLGSTETVVTATSAGAWRFRLLSGVWTLQPVAAHTHAASDITSGTLDIARIPTGTSSSTVCIGNDSRLSDSRAPTAHAAAHAVGGSDPLAPSDIGAQSIFATEALGTVTADVTLTAARAKIYTLNTTTSGLRILLPTTNVQTGDVVQIRFSSQNGSTIAPVRGTLTGFFGNSIRSGQQVTFIAESTSGTSWEETATNRTPPETITLTAGDVVVGKATSGAGTATQVSIGTEENSVARGNHVHGNLTNDGKIGSTAGLPVVTTTAGAVTTLALGTANQVLRVNSGATGVEFADPAASGVTGAAASASDVLGVSGSDITGVDAGSDKIVFWDDSASELTYLATVGPTFDGTNLRWPVELIIACSDETTNLTTGTAKVAFRAPYAFTLTGVRASVNTAPTGSTLIVDINNGANSALSTKLSIDASEKTSTTAATAAVIDTSYDDISDDAEITIDIDQIGSTIAGKGLKVVLIGTRA